MRPAAAPPSDETIGRRVTIRYRVDDAATDVIGQVLSVGERITLRRRDGSTVSVDADAIVVWKVVPDSGPPARPRRSR